MVILVILNLFVIWLLRCKFAKKPQYLKITVNGQKYLYICPEPEKENEFKGKYATPYIDKYGKMHIRYFQHLNEHKRSLVSTFKKHYELLVDFQSKGIIIPS
jgi:hypothetical protein